jgi:hypothetical protein
MRIERHKNFLSPEECSTLNSWVMKAIDNKWLDQSLSRGDWTYKKRLTTRMYGDRFEYPQFVLDISNKIRSFCGISSYDIVEGHGRDGVLCSCTFDGGDVYLHADGLTEKGLYVLRCNVVTQAPDSGGKLYVADELVDVEAGELHCYLASGFAHEVTSVEGNTPRILWMFGAAVPYEDWENGAIKFNNPIA